MATQRSPGGIEFFFQPFSGLEYSSDVPVLCIVFEDQQDMILAKAFPEINKIQQMFDKSRDRADETVSIFGASRGEQVVSLGIIYVRQPWRRKRGQTAVDIDGINLYRELWQRTMLATERVRSGGYDNFVVVLPSKFRPESVKNDRTQKQRLAKFVRSVVEAIVYANHSLDEFISNAPPLIKSVTLTYFGGSDREIDGFFRRSINEGQAVGQESGRIRQLTLLPANQKRPLEFINRAVGSAEFHKRKSRIWLSLKHHRFSSRTKVSCIYGKDEVRNFGLGLVHAVSRGSADPPVFLKLHHRPVTRRKKQVKKVVLIGKGIIFDTGGISFKGAESMENMNFDMAGAATVMGAFALADKTNLPVEVIALIPIMDNAIGPESTRRGDVIRAYNGKTVEITDTDAEGRLIIADAVAYSERKLNPHCTITVGTLSDMSDIAPDLIKVGVGDQRLIKRVIQAEDASAEKVLMLPSTEHLNEIYNEHLGRISDIVNDPQKYYHSAPFIFIYNFFESMKPEWFFVDPCSVFENDSENYGTGPGFGMKLVWYLLKQYA